jgi:hypothetical protein
MTLALAAQDGIVAAGEPLAPHHVEDRRPGPLVLPRQDRSRARERSGVADSAREPIALLGMGSNILVADAGFPRIVARLRGVLRVTVEGR